MALDFPNAPITGATFPGPNGALWQWDGEKWTAVSTSSTGGGGGASIVMQPSPPTLAANALWWDTIGGQLYVCYDDGVAPLQWVVASNIPGPPASQVTQVDVASAQRNVGRNLIHNALFTVAQRGAGPFTVNGVYSGDRWLLGNNTDAQSVITYAAVDGDRAQIGDEGATSILGNTFTGSAAAGAFNAVFQRMESVLRFSGKTVIISFYAKQNAGPGTKLGVSMDQYFGTGGSPSASVFGPGQAVTLTSTWTRYSVAIAVPTAIGKTVGTTAGTDWTSVGFWFSSGATNATRAGNVGVQSGNFALWGVQLEIAAPGQTAPTPLEKMDAQQTLATCQRFYQVGQLVNGGYHTTGGTAYWSSALPVSMRALPAMAAVSTNATNCAVASIGSYTSAAGGCTVWFSTVITATGAFLNINTFTASADL